MRSLYLHVGLEKTGTTAFQEGLLDSTGNHGTIILNYGNKTNKNLTQALLEYFGAGSSWSRATAGNVSQLVSSLTTDLERYADSDIVVSSEHFSGRFSQTEILLLISMLSKFHKVVVMIVDRDGSEWMNSKYNQAVKAGYSKSIKEYTAGKKSDWFARNDRAGIMDDWCGAGVEVKKFHYSASVVTEMLTFLGFEVGVIPRSNGSLSPRAVKILLVVNRVFMPGRAIKIRRIITKVLALFP